MPRLFIAIDPPEQLRLSIKSICHGLPTDTRWTPPEQFHLTLRFIGAVDDHLALLIKKALSDLSYSPFWLQIKGLGYFPPRRQPKILWAGVAINPDLEQLQGRIENRLVQLGLTPENRKFHPHLTIARLPPRLTPEILDSYLALHSQTSAAPFRVESFHLYSSLLTRYGAEHHLEGTYGAR